MLAYLDVFYLFKTLHMFIDKIVYFQFSLVVFNIVNDIFHDNDVRMYRLELLVYVKWKILNKSTRKIL